MLASIKFEIKPDVIIAAVKKMSKKERDSFLEDLLASTSPDYLKSIKEARSDYQKGRVKEHREVKRLKTYTKNTQKNMIHEKCESFGRFNDWERQMMEKPDSAISLAAVFELYDMIPDQARQRPVDVSGIIKMRSELACLG